MLERDKIGKATQQHFFQDGEASYASHIDSEPVTEINNAICSADYALGVPGMLYGMHYGIQQPFLLS